MNDGKMPSGLDLLNVERARQHGDALASFDAARAPAARIAESLNRTKRLLLIGMGGSHYVNRAVEPAYRARGIDATAITASELLAAPLPDRVRTAILTSQSGGSGEVLQLLDQAAGQEERFGITLEADSALAQRIPVLVGAGGTEKAFAATRSLLICLALHAAVLAELGEDLAPSLGYLRKPLERPVDAALQVLAQKKVIIVSGRGALAGLAEAGALCLMELGRLPIMAMEGGQFRHGPLEILNLAIGVILLRGPGEDSRLNQKLVATCREAGATPVVFDLSGEAMLEGAVTIDFPAASGFAAAFALLPSLQRLMIDLAGRHVPRVGEPLRTSKVTGIE
ncbi:MAG: SIS domain-containing protein [Dongiales bacterium]